MSTSVIFSLLTLTLMEIVLGIDNIVFISIIVGTLPEAQKATARRLGLGLALVARIGLLLGIQWVMTLETALFHWSSIGWVPDGWVESHNVDSVTGKDLILLGGGLFLIGKSVVEIHKKAMGGDEHEIEEKAKKKSFAGAITQIVILDLVFSLDSVISAVGMAKDLWVMITAMLIAIAFMATFAGRVSRFVDENPTFKMLALTFLVMIGVLLLTEGAGSHVNKGYIYGAMIFALLVEILNMRVRKAKDAKKKAALHKEHEEAPGRQSMA